jgi:hypothetical protein
MVRFNPSESLNISGDTPNRRPYRGSTNYAMNESHCGKRIAWSRAGGYAPVCYKEEITDEMASKWRGREEG